MDKRFEELRQDMNARFEQVDKRFEQVDKRFEQVDKRFSMMMWAIGIGFSIVVTFMGSSVVLLR